MKKLIALLALMAALAFVFMMACGGGAPPVEEPPPPPPPDTTPVVEEPPPPPPPPPPLELGTIHFEFDKYRLTDEARDILAGNASQLGSDDHMTAIIRIAGHCDERGSDEYNMALGEKRAAAARDYLVNYGISADRISIISYGESSPVNPAHNEDAWAQNRRAEFKIVSE